jgi:hypothetical protein
MVSSNIMFPRPRRSGEVDCEIEACCAVEPLVAKLLVSLRLADYIVAAGLYWHRE